MIESAEKIEYFDLSETARVFGEWLRGDAQSLNFVARLFVRSFGFVEKIQRVCDLLRVESGIEADEGCDGANFWFCRRRSFGWRLRLRSSFLRRRLLGRFGMLASDRTSGEKRCRA